MDQRKVFFLNKFLRQKASYYNLKTEINIETLKSQDPKEFEILVSQFEKSIFNMAVYLLQNKQEAEDATQEIFISIHQSIQFFKGDSLLSTWIYRITLNKCREIIRHKSRKKRFGIHKEINENYTFQLSSENKNPEDILASNERIQILMSAINSLPESQKIAYTLHNMDDFSYTEIAEMMQLSISAIESLIFRAKQNLRKKLLIYYQNNEQ